MALLTSFDSAYQVVLGEFLDISPTCLENIKNRRCSGFYDVLLRRPDLTTGFYICPKGYSVYVYRSHDKIRVFPCLRRQEDRRKIKRRVANDNFYLPVLKTIKLQALINHDIHMSNQVDKLEAAEGNIYSITHDFKSLNARIKQHCETIFSQYPEDSNTPVDVPHLFGILKEIMFCSTMIDGRFAMLDFEQAPEEYLKSSPFTCNIFKKFDKIRMLLSNYMRKHVKINLRGNCYKCITAYSSFEFIPFLILENAIKYSSPQGEIDVTFEVDADNLQVMISSFGPFCSSDDIQHVFEKGYRGQYAKGFCKGHGLGLFFVKKIADLHNIRLGLETPKVPTGTINGIPYSNFDIVLYFQNTFDEVSHA